MGEVIMSGIVPQLVAPSTGIALADIVEGSLVKLNENGSPVEFYVAKHDYESGLNGTGRTLLVRKDIHSNVVFNTSTSNVNYKTSEIDAWLNGTYASLLSADVKAAIATTKFYFTDGFYETANTLPTLTRSVFLLSCAELGFNVEGMNTEGAVLPGMRDILVPAELNGTAVAWWTRSICHTTTYKMFQVTAAGKATATTPSNSIGARPCFTLPATALFDEETLILKGVA